MATTQRAKKDALTPETPAPGEQDKPNANERLTNLGADVLDMLEPLMPQIKEEIEKRIERFTRLNVHQEDQGEEDDIEPGIDYTRVRKVHFTGHNVETPDGITRVWDGGFWAQINGTDQLLNMDHAIMMDMQPLADDYAAAHQDEGNE